MQTTNFGSLAGIFMLEWRSALKGRKLVVHRRGNHRNIAWLDLQILFQTVPGAIKKQISARLAASTLYRAG
jgi:hypothetical protein